jgi:hypothetical protein
MLESAAMPKTTRVSVTIDRALWDEFKQATEGKLKPSTLFAEAVQDEINRLGLLTLIEEMDREDPPTPEQRAKAARQWQRLSSWIPERFRTSPSEAAVSEEASASFRRSASARTATPRGTRP